MQVYLITILLIIMFCALAQHYDYNVIQFDSLNKVRHTKATFFFYVLALATLVFVAGFRYEVGTDFNGYFLHYETFANEFFGDFKKLDEPGFSFLCWLIVKCNGNGEIVIFIAALITVVLFLRTIYMYTDKLLMSTLLFVFLGCWHGCFNGVRQYLAAAILFAGISYIKQRKIWKYLLIVFIAFLFHSSAILMGLIYFISFNKVNTKNILLLILCSVGVLRSYDRVISLASFILSEDHSTTYEYLTNSVNVLRIMVAIVPAVFFLIMYIRVELKEEQLLWINMLILNATVMLATSNSTYLARMGIYTAPYLALGIPKLSQIFKSNSRKIVNLIIVMAYAIFWWYEVSHSSTLSDFHFIWQQ